MALVIASNKNWSDYEADSTTSLAIGSGALTALALTITTGKAYTAGDDIALVPTAAKIPMMLIGTVTSYNSGTGALVASIDRCESTIPGWDLVSASTNTVGTGAKTFVTYNGKSALLAASNSIMVSRQGTNGGNRMVGTVTSYDNANGTLVTNITSTIGSGTNVTDWVIVSAGTFSAWKIIPAPNAVYSLLGTAQLTMDMEPSYPVGSFQSLDRGRVLTSNASTTTPWVITFGTKNTNSAKLFDLFTSGAYDVTGARILVKTGDGTAGQTINYGASPLTKIDWPAIEVETGNGTGIFRPWYVALDNAVARGFTGGTLNRGFSASFVAATSATITLTTASPTVVSWAGNTLNPGDKFRYTTTGSITGMSVGVDYYVLHDSFIAGTSFKIGPSPFATPVNVTAQSGTHTGFSIPAVGSGDHGNIALWNPTTRTLKFGNGTQGNVIPNGARVRAPNIYFQMDHPRAVLQTAYASGAAGSGTALTIGRIGNLATGTAQGYHINGEEITATASGNVLTTVARNLNGTGALNHAQGDTVFTVYNATTNRAATDASDGGKVTWINCAFGLGVYPFIQNPQTASFTDVWTVGAFRVDSSTADTFADGVFCSPHPCGDGGVTFSSLLGSTSVNRIYGGTTASSAGGSPSAVALTSLQNVTKAENLEGVVLARNGTSTASGINATACVFNAYVKNITSIGGRISFQNSSRLEVDGIRHSAESNGIASTNAAQDSMQLQNVQFGVYRNISTVAGGVGPRSRFFATDANCANNVFHTITCNASSNSQGIIIPSGNNNTVARGTFGVFPDRGSTGNGTGAIVNTATGDTCVVRDCQFTPGDSYAADNGNGACTRAFIEQSSGHSMWWRASPNAFNGNYQEIGPFHVLLNTGTKAAGTLCNSFSVEASRDIYDLNGSAYLDNGGTVVLPVAGDFIIQKSYQLIRTITGFTGSVAFEDVNNANLTYSFEMVGDEGTFTGTYTALTTANLNTALAAISGYDDAHGFKFRLKIEATASDATNKVIQVRMPTTNNAATVLPIGYSTYTMTDLDNPTSFAAFDGAEELDYKAVTSGSATLSLPYDFDGLMADAHIKVRCLDCNWDDHALSYNQYAQSRVSLQTPDTEVTVTNAATVAAYTTLETPAKLYDYVKYWGSLRANLTVDKLCTKVGSDLDFGSYDIVISNAVGVPLGKAGNTVTIKADALNGGSLTTTGTITFGGTSTTGTTALSGSNGKSGILTVSGLTSTAVYIKNNSGTQFDYSASVTGTYSVVIPFGSTGTWTAVTKRAGYRHAYFNFTASDGGAFNTTPSMPEKTNPDGSPMYTASSSAFVAVSFTGTTQANIDIADGVAELQPAFDETEPALMTNAGMIWLASGKSDVSQFNSAGGDYLFLSTGWRLRRASAGDSNATLNAFAQSADGIVVDDINGGVQFLTSDSPTAIAAAVWAYATRTLTVSAGGATLAEIEGSTVLAKEATSAAIKAKTDNLPASPAAVGSAMTLTSAYDAAKTAASQTSVNAIPTTPAPAAATVASAVRTELATELARVDANVSSRSTYAGADTSGTTTLLSRVTGAVLLASNYTAPLDSTATQSAAAAALNAYDGPTKAELDAAVAPLATTTNLDTLPTLAEMEASVILSKQATTQVAATKASLAAALSA
jgi:hypothetical protein